MIRLGAFLLATLAGLFITLSYLGQGDLRADRRPATQNQPAARDAGSILPRLTAEPEPEPAAPAVVQVESQTPQQVQRFPGPALSPSPEHAGGTPSAPPASFDAGAALAYVVADRVNVRGGPSTSDRVVMALTHGAAVQALGPLDTEWVNIRDQNGREGYVAGRFLSATAP